MSFKTSIIGIILQCDFHVWQQQNDRILSHFNFIIISIAFFCFSYNSKLNNVILHRAWLPSIYKNMICVLFTYVDDEIKLDIYHLVVSYLSTENFFELIIVWLFQNDEIWCLYSSKCLRNNQISLNFINVSIILTLFFKDWDIAQTLTPVS